MEANIEDHFKMDSIFGWRERKYANTWGSGGRARGQKSLQNTSIVFRLFFNNCFPLRF